MSNDPQLLADDMAKILGFYKQKESHDSETNLDQIFGNEKTQTKFKFTQNFHFLDDSNNRYNSTNLSWEF
jgi:hypothetical protein